MSWLADILAALELFLSCEIYEALLWATFYRFAKISARHQIRWKKKKVAKKFWNLNWSDKKG